MADKTKPIMRITVEDLETGERQTQEVPKGEYVILTTAPCHVAHTSVYTASGTCVITVKGRTAR